MDLGMLLGDIYSSYPFFNLLNLMTYLYSSTHRRNSLNHSLDHISEIFIKSSRLH